MKNKKSVIGAPAFLKDEPIKQLKPKITQKAYEFISSFAMKNKKLDTAISYLPGFIHELKDVDT